MQVREPAMPGDPSGSDSSGSGTSGSGSPGGAVGFRVPAQVTVAKFGTAAVLLIAGLLFAEGASAGVALAAAVAVAAYGARDLAARERLRADAGGVVVVRGYARRRRLAWSEIERVRVDRRMRLGARTELLEVDAGDELYLYSRFDLGVDVADALAAIEAVRPANG
ncbi:MAG TPA: PH domain-containing protein [Micromonosporaceae bacterium]|nr:PH domain-containing protein [Micromonosporaceae bacterium]